MNHRVAYAHELAVDDKFEMSLTGARGVVIEVRDVALAMSRTLSMGLSARAPRVKLIGPYGVVHRTLHPFVKVLVRVQTIH